MATPRPALAILDPPATCRRRGRRTGLGVEREGIGLAAGGGSGCRPWRGSSSVIVVGALVLVFVLVVVVLVIVVVLVVVLVVVVIFVVVIVVAAVGRR